MSNIMPVVTKNALLADWLTDTVKIALIDGDDVGTAPSTWDFFDDVSAGSIATATLTSKTVTGGNVDADDVTFTALTGDEFEYIVVYTDTGVPSTSRIWFIFDTAAVPAGPISFVPPGTDLIVAFNASGIFGL